MALLILATTGGVIAVWAAVILLAGPLLLRPKTSPVPVARRAAARPAPKRREDFTLTS